VGVPPNIRDANRGGVVLSLQRAMSGQAGAWLAGANPYLTDTVKTIENQALDASSLADYIAASVPLHCADGWSYVGRAIESHLQNDTDAARHLAYYAELRAALSVLAAYGVGVFNRRHFVVTAAGVAQPLPDCGGTHPFAAEALTWWAKLPDAGQMLGVVIRPEDIPLNAWVQEFSPGQTIAPIATRLLLEWGFDVLKVGMDREARNEASYRPTQLVPRQDLPLADGLAFLRAWWQAFEPSGASRFGELDRYLLRRTLHFLFTNSASAGGQPAFAKGVDSTVSTLMRARPDPARTRLATFLREASNLPPLLKDAQGTDSPAHRRHHLQVIARASLLLRVATGAAQQLLLDAAVSPADLNFWIERLAIRCGLWRDSGDRPDPVTDLWDDVVAALDQLDELEAQGAPVVKSRPSWARQTEVSTGVLGGAERVPVWAFA